MSLVNFNSIPLEVYGEIAEKFLPAVLPEDFEPAMYMCRKSGRDLKALMCVNQAFRDSSAPIMKKLLGILETISDVRVGRFAELKREYCSLRVEGDVHPMLLDACLSGRRPGIVCGQGMQEATYDKVTPKIIKDIKAMVTLAPVLLNCRTAKFRVQAYVYEVTPLLAAAQNKAIPKEVITFFLSKMSGEIETYRGYIERYDFNENARSAIWVKPSEAVVNGRQESSSGSSYYSSDSE